MPFSKFQSELHTYAHLYLLLSFFLVILQLKLSAANYWNCRATSAAAATAAAAAVTIGSHIG